MKRENIAVVTSAVFLFGSEKEGWRGSIGDIQFRGVNALSEIPEEGWVVVQSKKGGADYYRTKNKWTVELSLTESGRAVIQSIEDTEEAYESAGGLNLPKGKGKSTNKDIQA